MSWRFIPYAEFDGALNMAIDTQLLMQAKHTPPVLRLYSFSPPCLSIGFNQKLAPEIVERVLAKGFEIVRRPSGGRAVLHYKDLTYAFIGAEKGTGEFGFLESSVSAAYKQICSGLQEFFVQLGILTELGSAETSYRHLADCFLATTNADLHFQGRKLVGSAQLRKRGAVLQHGSMPLYLEQEVVPELLFGEQENGTQKERHANLFEILASEPSMDSLNQSMKAGFEKAFAVELSIMPLNQEELKKAEASKAEFFYCRNN